MCEILRGASGLVVVVTKIIELSVESTSLQFDATGNDISKALYSYHSYAVFFLRQTSCQLSFSSDIVTRLKPVYLCEFPCQSKSKHHNKNRDHCAQWITFLHLQEIRLDTLMVLHPTATHLQRKEL